MVRTCLALNQGRKVEDQFGCYGTSAGNRPPRPCKLDHNQLWTQWGFQQIMCCSYHRKVSVFHLWHAGITITTITGTITIPDLDATDAN